MYFSIRQERRGRQPSGDVLHDVQAPGGRQHPHRLPQPCAALSSLLQAARPANAATSKASFRSLALLKLLRDHKPHFNKENTHIHRREIPPQLKPGRPPAPSTSHAEHEPCLQPKSEVTGPPQTTAAARTRMHQQFYSLCR